MAHKIAGIDLCHGGIRIVVLGSGFRKIQVDSVEEIALPAGCWKRDDNNELSLSEDCLRLLREWVEGNLAQGDVAVVSYPAIFSIIKTLKFPFKDPEKIRTALPFQLIGNFPADIEEIVADFDFVETGNKDASVIAAGVIKEKFAGFLSGLKEANIDPRVVTSDGFALRDLMKFVDTGRRNENLLFANVCGDRIEIFASSAGKPAYVRNIYLHGIAGNGDMAGYASRELKAAILAFMTREGGRIDGVVAGGDESSEIFGIALDLFDEFGIPRLDFNDLQIEMEGAGEVGGVFMKAFSLAIRGLLPAEQGRINFRRGEFIYSGNLRFI
ncbi:MAG: hypothetical protein FJ088_15790, partial [Deltaproteobacteria bacterium]|nr:hypothetical protein [Deltaproteobacteria bacterium]